ncbi:putative uncharacterized protein DDB_G0282133 [Teleopsis dalmanni]|uniref:putative uncharacterized protein DDB_G0282133 n=1 Tax=Teleopsis dalmanni TaxID=139649 RepID=UPI0018CFD832|nr:putative uncharacterized protein DDB_G0282133 [Teleopsis dalmanni]
MNTNLNQSDTPGTVEREPQCDEVDLGQNSVINLNNVPSLSAVTQPIYVDVSADVDTTVATESDSSSEESELRESGGMNPNGYITLIPVIPVICTIIVPSVITTGPAEVRSTPNVAELQGNRTMNLNNSPSIPPLGLLILANVTTNETQSNEVDFEFQTQRNNFNAISTDVSNINNGMNLYGFFNVSLIPITILPQNVIQYTPISYNAQNNNPTDPHHHNNILQSSQSLLMPYPSYQTQPQVAQLQFRHQNQYPQVFSQQGQMTQQQPTLQSQPQFVFSTPNVTNLPQSQRQNQYPTPFLPQLTPQFSYSSPYVTNLPQSHRQNQIRPRLRPQSQSQFDYSSAYVRNQSQSSHQHQYRPRRNPPSQTQFGYSSPNVRNQSQTSHQHQYRSRRNPQSQPQFGYSSPNVIIQSQSQRQNQYFAQIYHQSHPQFGYSSPNVINQSQFHSPAEYNNVLMPQLQPNLQSQLQFDYLSPNITSHEYDNSNRTPELFHNHYNRQQEASTLSPNIEYNSESNHFNSVMEQANGNNERIANNINMEHITANFHNLNIAETPTDAYTNSYIRAYLTALDNYYLTGSVYGSNAAVINENNVNANPNLSNNIGGTLGTDSNILSHATVAPMHNYYVLNNTNPPNIQVDNAASTQQQPMLIGYMTPQGFVSIYDMNLVNHY